MIMARRGRQFSAFEQEVREGREGGPRREGPFPIFLFKFGYLGTYWLTK